MSKLSLSIATTDYDPFRDFRLGDVTLGCGGGSSTLLQKTNPVAADRLVDRMLTALRAPADPNI
jgi:hypothetical protein